MKRKAPLDLVSTLLGSGTSIEGTLTFQDTIRLDGAVKGEIVSEKGTLIIGERAVIEARIQVGSAIVRGTVNGQILAADRIELYSPADIRGDIQAPVVSIETGVRLNGNCRVAEPGPRIADPAHADAKPDPKQPK